ncbi:MAG: ASPIC/UnbV domain-containing protein [Planctomycetes bacterium]|nr:ASPIC/UnbV domain-containing protein [Planctomycetota bacterium]
MEPETPAGDPYRRHHDRVLFDGGLSFSGLEEDRVWLNRGDGTFVDATGVSGANAPEDGRAAVLGDFDGDGDTDIFVHRIQGERHLFLRNAARPSRHRLVLCLVGAPPNTGAVGARVRVVAGGRAQVREVACGWGYLSGHDLALAFGLGDATSVASVEVRWPSGRVQSWEGLPADHRVTPREGEPEAVRVPLAAPR